jgi:ribonuclease P protein component
VNEPRTTTAPLRFPKARRLTRSAEFLRVKTAGATQRGALMMLGIMRPEEQLGCTFRVGFVTSRRIGGAVVRNRVRRQLREIVRQHQHEICEGVWLVVIARPPAARANFAALEGEWLRLARRGGVLRAGSAS